MVSGANCRLAQAHLPGKPHNQVSHETIYRSLFIQARGVLKKELLGHETLVENTIAPLLPHAEVGANTVARRIGLSERTFSRRLKAESLSFSEILNDLRRDLAMRYLDERSLPVSQIAWLLGFHGPSAFTHACRRWTGKSPSSG